MSFITRVSGLFKSVEASYEEGVSTSVSSEEEVDEKKCSLNLTARAINLGLLPVSVLGCGLGVAVGVPLSAVNCLTGRKFRRLDEISHNLLYWGGNCAIALPFRKVLHMVNPEAQITEGGVSLKKIGGFDASRLGIATHIVYELIAYFEEDKTYTYQGEQVVFSHNGLAQKMAKSDSFFKREVASRLSYGLLLLTCVITRVIDTAIGAVAAVFALLTLGYFEELNSLAYHMFRITGIVYDLFYCLSHMINPHNPVDPFDPKANHTVEKLISKKNI